MIIPSITDLNKGRVPPAIIRKYTASQWSDWANKSDTNLWGGLDASTVVRYIPASVFNTLATGNSIVPSRTLRSLNAQQFSRWMDANLIADLSASALNGMPQALGGVSPAQFSSWLASTNSSFSDLSASAINGMPQVLGGVSPAQFSSWLASTNNSFSDLSASALNGMPQALGGVSPAQFNSWLANTNNSVADLSPSALNGMRYRNPCTMIFPDGVISNEPPPNDIVKGPYQLGTDSKDFSNEPPPKDIVKGPCQVATDFRDLSNEPPPTVIGRCQKAWPDKVIKPDVGQTSGALHHLRDLALGSVVQATAAADLLVNALSIAGTSVFMDVTDRSNTSRSMAWLSNAGQLA